jgi:UDP-glucose 4-epimerase
MGKREIILIGKNSFIGQKLAENLGEKEILHVIKNQINYYSKPNWFNLIKNNTTIVFLAFENSLSAQKKNFYSYNINILNFFNLLDKYLKKNKIFPNIVFTSTVTVYGDTKSQIVNESFNLNPKTEYDISKIFFEKILIKLSINYNVKITILRLSNVLGLSKVSKQKDRGVLGKIIKNIKNNKEVKIYGSGKYLRDYIYIDDLVEGMIKCIKNTKPGIYNLCSGKSYSLLYIVKKIIKMYNLKVKIKFIKFAKNSSQIEKRNFIGSNKHFSESFNWKTKFNLHKSLKSIYGDKL